MLWLSMNKARGLRHKSSQSKPQLATIAKVKQS